MDILKKISFLCVFYGFMLVFNINSVFLYHKTAHDVKIQKLRSPQTLPKRTIIHICKRPKLSASFEAVALFYT